MQLRDYLYDTERTKLSIGVGGIAREVLFLHIVVADDWDVGFLLASAANVVVVLGDTVDFGGRHVVVGWWESDLFGEVAFCCLLQYIERTQRNCSSEETCSAYLYTNLMANA